MVINKKILLTLYKTQKLTLREIAIRFKVTHVYILYLMKQFNIRRRTKSEAQIGRVFSYKTRLKMSKIKKGKPSIFKGVQNRYSEETLKLMRIINTRNARKGSKHHNWRGGVSKIGYPYYFNKDLKEKIRERDNLTCQCCGIKEEKHYQLLKRNLTVHHIDYNKENCKEDNLITVCRSCNLRANYHRNYWKIFYQNKL